MDNDRHVDDPDAMVGMVFLKKMKRILMMMMMRLTLMMWIKI